MPLELSGVQAECLLSFWGVWESVIVVGVGLQLACPLHVFTLILQTCVQSVRLVELLDEAKTKCSGTIRERREISDEELDKSAGIMGYAAVKYADLKNNRATNYK